MKLIMHPDIQLFLWVRGMSIHNGLSRKEGECLPDFSCCLLADHFSPSQKTKYVKQHLNLSENDSVLALLFL